MEIAAVAGEVRYSLRIPYLSTYSEEDHLTSEFSLSLGGLRSRWQVTLQPFLSAKPNKAHDMNSDIGITLSCLTSNITSPDIDIYCNVVGRGQAHEKKLDHMVEDLNVSDHVTPTWQGVLVPRLALHVFNLLPQDTLTATLRFVVRADDVWRFNDPLEEMSAQLGELRTGKYSDVTIVTSDGATLPAHSLILNARSELLQADNEAKCSPDSFEKHTTPQSVKCHKTERKQPATPIDSMLGSDMSSLSGYHSLSSSSCVSSPLGRPESSLVGRVTPASPAPSIPTPRRLFTPSNTMGEKRFLSPCKSSPSKRPAPKVTSSPRRRVFQQENETPKRSPLPPLSCHSVNSTSSSSSTTPSKAPLKKLEIWMPRYEVSQTVKVNMSSSVAKAMLDWIYTGETVHL